MMMQPWTNNLSSTCCRRHCCCCSSSSPIILFSNSLRVKAPWTTSSSIATTTTTSTLFTKHHLLPSPRTHTSGSVVVTTDEEEEELSVESTTRTGTGTRTRTRTRTRTSFDESEFIEIGYICNVHGLQGDLRVKPNTDFPELRFSKPGRRWFKERVSGKEIIREIDLVEGRHHPGQHTWIVSFRGIDTVDKAKLLVGSILLVSKEERPLLDEGEFYTWQLVGMKVILKDTGQSVGTVVNVFNSGASDLLQVKLNSREERQDGTGSQDGHLVWVPFAEAIVPDVDIEKMVVQITPPKGLLELNLRTDERSKKERRLLEWRERKKGTRRVIAAKKKLCEMEQKHVFHGLRFGEIAQRNLLADQIVGLNLKLFQQAMQNFEKGPARWNLSKFVNDNSVKVLRCPPKILEHSLVNCGASDKLYAIEELKGNGVRIISEGKVAIVLVADDNTNHQGRSSGLEYSDSGTAEKFSYTSLLQDLFNDDERLVKVGKDFGLLPLVVVSSSHEIQSIQKLFLDHDYFTFDNGKVWFLEEENLPVISSLVDEQTKHKILMKSPWEVLQSPVGSGGIFSLLSAHNIIENLSEMGIEHVQVCSLSKRSMVEDPLFLGFVISCKADMGIKVFTGKEDVQEDFSLIFSLRFLKKMAKQIDKIQFHAIGKQRSHVEMINKEWVNIIPTSPNSYELHCSIYSSLNACSPDKVCTMEVAD